MKRGWVVLRNPDHVVPEGERHETMGDPCPCMPRDVDGVTVHNSYDRRECGEVLAKLLRTICEVAADNHQWSDAQRGAVEHAEAIVALHWPEMLT